MHNDTIMPSLKEAQKRTKRISQIIDDAFEIPAEMVGFGKGKKYFIKTYGCQANERDTETLNGILELLGYEKCDDANVADVILLNTCAIRENAEQKVFGKIGAIKFLKRTNPNIIFGICGCMAQEESVVNEIMQKHNHIDLVFGTHNIHRLPFLLKEAMQDKAQVIEVWSKEGDILENLPTRRDHASKAWVNIMYGCDKFCTYCIVPYTRGKERSRAYQDILNEVIELKNDGYHDITLLGQNVNAYGKDFEDGYRFENLLEDVAKTGIDRIRFSTSHPWDFSDEMIRIIAAYPNIMPYIHLPVQSGNSDVLKTMGRRYSREDYLTLFDKIKAAIPHASFSTDIIVGFPNETDEQFRDTLSIVDYCQFDNAYTFIYSPRKGTPAANMEDNVPFEVKQQRLYELNDKVKLYSNKQNKRFEGEIVRVLVEGPSKKNAEVLSGYTEHMKLVNFVGDKSLIGKIVDVKIVEAKSWSLNGELVSE